MGYFSLLIVLICKQVDKLDDERELLRGLSANDAVAIEEIYRNNFGAIQALIIKNGGNSEDASDLFQEAMVVLFQNSQSDSFVLTSSLKTYLYSVSRRLWLKKLQKEKRLYLTTTDVLSDIVPVEDDLETYERKSERLELLELALEKIGEPCRSLLKAFYIDKKSMPEIATLFGYTNSANAKTQKYKCLMRLKKIFFSKYKSGD